MKKKSTKPRRGKKPGEMYTALNLICGIGPVIITIEGPYGIRARGKAILDVLKPGMEATFIFYEE